MRPEVRVAHASALGPESAGALRRAARRYALGLVNHIYEGRSLARVGPITASARKELGSIPWRRLVGGRAGPARPLRVAVTPRGANSAHLEITILDQGAIWQLGAELVREDGGRWVAGGVLGS